MMTDRSLRVLLLACLVAAAPLAAPARAQQQPLLSPDEEISPRQVQQQAAPKPSRPTRSLAPAANPEPAARSHAALPTYPDPAAHMAQATNPALAARTVACSGLFAKDSSHVKLADAVGAKNIDFGSVSGAGGSSLNASILYPTDPKRRLEVLWQDEAARTDTSMIVITGQSQWHAPKGLHIGLALAALEKLNGKPFKVAGFDQPDGSSVIDWLGGALADLPGDCQVGIKLVADHKATPDALAAAAGSELMSSDATVRALKPAIGEIILGYSQ